MYALISIGKTRHREWDLHTQTTCALHDKYHVYTRFIILKIGEKKKFVYKVKWQSKFIAVWVI